VGWQESPLIAGLTGQERDEFLGLARPRFYARNEQVCVQGDPADSVHLVVKGRLAVRFSLADGSATLLQVVGPGDCIGELALWQEPAVRTASVHALESVETLSIASSSFRNLCVRRPSLEHALVSLLADRVIALSTSLVQAMHEPLERRVHRRLLELAATYGDLDPVDVPLTQAQLAEMAGGARPTVNHVLQGLEAQGTVRLARGRIVVLDRTGLQVD
jgi:CRP/FNR family transcriptional regulator, cyclic AMP receptor protein